MRAYYMHTYRVSSVSRALARRPSASFGVVPEGLSPREHRPGPGIQWVPEVAKRAGRYGLPTAARCVAVQRLFRAEWIRRNGGPPW